MTPLVGLFAALAGLGLSLVVGGRELVFLSSACVGAACVFLMEQVRTDRAHREDALYEIFIASEDALIEEKLKFAGVGQGDVVFDLGAGDGRVVIAAAQRFGARGVGVEARRALAREARKKARAAGVAGQTKFVRRDYMKANVATADVLVLYLTWSSLGELEPKLEQELKPGARVVTHDIPFPHWNPVRDMGWEGPKGETATFYLYTR